MYRLRLLISLAALVFIHGEEIPREQLLLARVRTHMASLLSRLPNYTCLQTIERTERTQKGKTRLIDVIRLEVALVDGKELFAWPGSKKFDDTSITDMVKGGAIGNGNFAMHAKAVFQSRAPRFQFAGSSIGADGKEKYKWDFFVPQNLSGYQIGNFIEHATIGYHGSFWADPTTLDVTRLEVYADDIPRNLKIGSASDAVDYQSVKLGEEAFLLPARSELSLSDIGGVQHRNRTNFSSCRQYTGESTISFDDLPRAEAVREPERSLVVPLHLRLEVALETPLDDESSAIGDPVIALLKRPVKLGSGLTAPKGARLHGRVTHLRKQQTQTPGWVVGLTFFELEWLNTRAELRAKLLDTPSLAMRAALSSTYRKALSEMAHDNGVFFVPGSPLRVPRGFLIYLETEPLEAEDKQ
jgi:hypothetical protein